MTRAIFFMSAWFDVQVLAFGYPASAADYGPSGTNATLIAVYVTFPTISAMFDDVNPGVIDPTIILL
jgi:hypothetical protein